MTDPARAVARRELLRYLSVSGLFITVALSYTGGLQGTGDTRSPLYISIVSQIVVPLGLCAVLQATRGLQPQRHLAGHRPRPLHALRCSASSLPPAEVARHPGGHRAGTTVIAPTPSIRCNPKRKARAA